MNTTDHPTPKQLDRWHAGLVGASQARSLAAHVDRCQRCRKQINRWRELGTTAGSMTLVPAIQGPLRARRRAVLAGEARATRRWRLRPLAVTGTLVVALGAGLLYGLPSGKVEGENQFYAEIDFYVWLDEQAPADPENGPGS